jgi:hypothetical protein
MRSRSRRLHVSFCLAVVHPVARKATTRAGIAEVDEDPRTLATHAAKALFPQAAAAGLLEEILVLGAARTRVRDLAGVIQHVKKTARLGERIFGSRPFPEHRTAERRRYNQYSAEAVSTSADRREWQRSRRVREAAESLIDFEQRFYRNWAATEGPVLPLLLVLEFQATRMHAFEAVRRRRQGDADARQILLKVTDQEPLTCCDVCGRIFPDNLALPGRQSRRCPEHQHDGPSLTEGQGPGTRQHRVR